MTAVSDGAAQRAPICRDAVTWYAYLLLGYFTYLATSQGNIVPFLMEELGLSYGVVSLHSSMLAVGVLIIGLIGDRIVARFSRRATLAGSALVSATAVALLAAAPSVQVTVSASFLIGLTGAFIPAIVPALLSDIHGSRRDVAITESNALSYVFAIAAPLIAGYAVWMGWSWRLVPLSAVAAAVVIVATYWRYPVPSGVVQSAAADNAPLPAAYWGYWAMLGFAVALEFSALLWAPAYLEKVVGLTPSAAAVGGGAFFAAMLVGRTAGIRLVGIYSPRAIFLALMVLTFAGFAAYWTAGTPWLAIVGLFFVGLGISLLFPLTISFALGVAGPASDRAATRVMLAPGLAIVFNPPLLGSLADGVGLWLAQLMIPVFASLVLASYFVAWRLERA